MSASSASPSQPSNQNTALGNIKHVIVLMFENRSFDHLLGAMPGVNGILDTQGNVLPAIYNTMHPLDAVSDSNPSTVPSAIVPVLNPATPPIPLENTVVTHDFTHDFGDGMLQDLFGPGTTGVLNGLPQHSPSATFPATNSGFLSTLAYDVGKQNGSYVPNGPGALSYFNWQSMKVFHQLAANFLVCDAWHCDMPGHTSVNRAFMHCATTGDLGINDDDAVGLSRMVNRTSIFELIQQQQASWKVYSQNDHLDTNWLNEQVFSQNYNSGNPTAVNVTGVPIQNFYSDLTNGTLPFYSFIMCWRDGSPDTSMHPNSNVEAAENLLACVYNALQSSSSWQDTLLIVNFDENGGMYDHVSVPQATPPDYDPSGQQPPVSTWTSSYTGQTYSFDFSVLGPRIPVLLISPWLSAGVCSMPLQNTSILRFLEDLLPTADSNNPFFLTQRDLNAPSIAPVFDDSQFGTQQARTDCPTSIALYGNCITCAQIQAGDTPDAAALAAPPTLSAVKLTKEYFGALPGHPDSGQPITHQFATLGELRAYAKERKAAALAYVRSKSHRAEAIA